MELKQIADELVAGCRENRTEENLGKLYADTAVSIEPIDQGGGREANGLDAIRGKHKWWAESAQVHEAKVGGPYLHGDDKFAVTFWMDVTMRETNERSQMQEVAVYHVADGKIVREEFFY